MSAEIMQRLVDDGHITPHQISDLLSCSRSAAYRRLGELDLSYAELRTLIRRSGKPAVAEHFLADLLGGLNWDVQHLGGDLDIDGDGDVDTDDLRQVMVDQLQALAHRTDKLHQSLADGRLEADEATDLRQRIAEARRLLVAMDRIIGLCSRPTRRKAKSVAGR